PFKNMAALYKNASVFVFPSLYEGFGLSILEAFASKIPLILAKNSSFPEVGGDAALYFDEKNADDLAEKIKTIINDESIKNDLTKKGEIQLEKFSWDKCAKETLEFIKS
ncbi:MAG: glycosyltransferase, partial [Patescibacteria group bacterium]